MEDLIWKNLVGSIVTKEWTEMKQVVQIGTGLNWLMSMIAGFFVHRGEPINFHSGRKLPQKFSNYLSVSRRPYSRGG
jgi:hypothetical protein